MITLDIFCNVIDNYGDAGVCLHLARTLSHQDYQVRLFCNNLSVLNTIINEQDPSNNKLEVVNWESPLTSYQPASVVISAFNCRFDECTLQALRNSPQCIIINLEYLSAESWVEDCHGLTSFVDGLSVYYFFPGFTAKTGGLNVDTSFKEHCLIVLQKLKQYFDSLDTTLEIDKKRSLTLFGYHNPQVAKLIDSLKRSAYHNELLVFEGLALDNLQELLSQELSLTHKTALNSQLEITVSPMVSHERYDELLLSHDFNLVRGEDSIVRAMHTGHPFLWHIYPQDEKAHIVKLSSFLEVMEKICTKNIPELMTTKSNSSETEPYIPLSQEHLEHAFALIKHTMLAYNGAENFEDNFDIDEFERVCAPVYYNFAYYLCQQPDLGASLDTFIKGKLNLS